jgi:hypothetical protein
MKNVEDTRKKWIQPQLIVLGRGTPEENVLAGCKTSKLTGQSATKVSCKKIIFNICNLSTKCAVTTSSS